MKGGGVEQLKDGTPPQNIRSHGVELTDETCVLGRSQLEQRRDRCTTLVAATRQNPRTESEAEDKIQELNLKPTRQNPRTEYR